jgi:PPM family protein phosphatase
MGVARVATACPECGEPVGADDRFCEACGSDLRIRRGSSVTAASTARGGDCTRCGEPAPHPPDEYCPGCGLRRRDGTERVELDLERLAGVSDRGRVHARNEDAVALGRLTGNERTAAAVCDGVSSAYRPELAARVAADAALDALLAAGPEHEPDASQQWSSQQCMRAAIASAADAVTRLAASDTGNVPSCTLVSALIEGGEAEHPEITVGWVGDSRAYWLAAPQAAEPARLLTTDHSWAVEQVAAGELDEAAAARHPLAHAITRWLGADAPAEPDVVTLRPAGPGVLLLCTDGLWNYRPDPADLAALARPVLARGPLAAATALTTVALQAGGRDNVTVVVIPVGRHTERRSS